jgi:hypothetical protein
METLMRIDRIVHEIYQLVGGDDGEEEAEAGS